MIICVYVSFHAIPTQAKQLQEGVDVINVKAFWANEQVKLKDLSVQRKAAAANVAAA